MLSLLSVWYFRPSRCLLGDRFRRSPPRWSLIIPKTQWIPVGKNPPFFVNRVVHSEEAVSYLLRKGDGDHRRVYIVVIHRWRRNDRPRDNPRQADVSARLHTQRPAVSCLAWLTSSPQHTSSIQHEHVQHQVRTRNSRHSDTHVRLTPPPTHTHSLPCMASEGAVTEIHTR